VFLQDQAIRRSPPPGTEKIALVEIGVDPESVTEGALNQLANGMPKAEVSVRGA